MEAGHKVMSLFAQRGWATIISDDLITNVLSLMSIVIGCLTGCVGLALAAAHKSWVSEFPQGESMWIPFMSAFLVGVLIASILVSCAAFIASALLCLRFAYPSHCLLYIIDERGLECCRHGDCVLCRSPE